LRNWRYGQAWLEADASVRSNSAPGAAGHVDGVNHGEHLRGNRRSNHVGAVKRGADEWTPRRRAVLGIDNHELGGAINQAKV
jgi:hypothetical protein